MMTPEKFAKTKYNRDWVAMQAKIRQLESKFLLKVSSIVLTF